ncbi:Crp/Fnr family transcriptional regulator [Sphaerotilus mobilis]|uniref:CRP-like cAMP-binding protein n=1 Tax=Sphaerotilus mobilis TaxID=47994 RepID=A0A4Q7LJY7_9BURK|nr:Crp/Fnr family transcriptional regulator [Sphaerotilus mobilis]RZS54955.1 CRP-like cAMP-binding protein [Sphaerotilus mobilis]
MDTDACIELDLRLSSGAMNSRAGRSGPILPSLHDLPISPALRALAERAEPRRYRKGVLLIQEGDQGDTLYIVLSGKVRAYSQGDNDREITYGVYGAGEYIGEISLDGGPRSASVMTLEPTVCVVIPRQTLLLHIAQYPEFAFELLSKVIRRARSATLSAKQLALNDVYGRLRALLESLAETRSAEATPAAAASVDSVLQRLTGVNAANGMNGMNGTPGLAAQESPPRRVPRLTHQDMANRLGCSREMVSRLMKDLEHGGYVTVEGADLILHRALPARW